MSQNDPYAKLGGGALDQELFKNKQTPLSSTDHSDKTIKSPTPESPPARKQSKKKVNNPTSDNVMTSSLHDANFKGVEGYY